MRLLPVLVMTPLTCLRYRQNQTPEEFIGSVTLERGGVSQIDPALRVYSGFSQFQFYDRELGRDIESSHPKSDIRRGRAVEYGKGRTWCFLMFTDESLKTLRYMNRQKASTFDFS